MLGVVDVLVGELEPKSKPIRVDDPAKGQYQPEMKVQTFALSILYVALGRPFCFPTISSLFVCLQNIYIYIYVYIFDGVLVPA